MAAASSSTNASHLTSTSTHDPVLSGIVASHHQMQSSQIVLSNTLPPATTLRGNNSSIHSVSPSTTTSTVHTLSGEIVPVIIHHHHHHHHLINNSNNNNNISHDNFADSSTLMDTASPIITTTTTTEMEHHHAMMRMLDDCSPSTSTSTTILMQATSSTTINSPMIKQSSSSSSCDASTNSPMSSHHNNNTIHYRNTDPIIGGGNLNEISTTPTTTTAGFLQQCSSSHLNNDNINMSENRVIVVNQSSPNSNHNQVRNSEMHNMSNVMGVGGCGEIIDDSIISTNQQQPLQLLQNNDKSCSTDNLHLNISNDDSLSSSDSADLQIKLDENGGYQDNTSSNSQQSGGGGSVSGGNGIGGVNNGTNNYVTLMQPSIGQSGIGGHSVSGNLSGIGIGGGHGVGPGSGGGGNGGGPHHGGSGGQSVGHQASGSEQTDFKYLFEELCPVCGDKVSGYHYGLLTCESCKGFFKRTVQNKKVYTCVAERRCMIDKTQRKRCPYCRFQKCLDVGMKLEAVRADRMRGGRNKFGPMYKRDRARKLQMMRQRQLAIQAIRGSMSAVDVKPGQISPTGYQQSYPSMNIKQEIQIPQVSSLTQSPDSSPSPIAIALGQVNPSTAIIATTLGGSSSGPGSTNTTTVSGAGGGSANCGPGSDNGSSSLQHSSDSKLCFDSGTNPSSTADSVSTVELRVSPMIREFVQSVDDREWQTQLFTLLQKQSYNQVEVDLFELMCKVLDQNLFSQVDWARNTVFFKDLKVDDQMKLLQHSWSDMLVLDHLHQRIHNGLPDETPLHNGQIFNLLGLGLLGVPQLGDYFNELQNKLQELKFDMGDYVCMKFLILLNPNCTDVRGIINRKTVIEGHENVQAALLDYTLTCYPSVTDKFSRLLNILPEIHALATRGEEHLYLKHCAGSAPTQTLLMEMLHAKRKV